MIFYVVEFSAVWNVGVPRWKNSRNLESLKGVVSRLWKRFEDDGKMSRRRYITDRSRVTAQNEDPYLAEIQTGEIQ
ncbi:hypothetical protein TNCV_3680661 [Trichonephila clavipes]|nr:hypothetical protein TNCV_3680661 [Trichonephila clavipes]